MKESTIIKIDIKGFNKFVQAETPEDSGKYILKYYQTIQSIISAFGWRFIKGIGDCVLISADSNTDKITELYDGLSRDYKVRLHYRPCSYSEKQISIGQYSCLDIFGKDINNLFLGDSLTTKMD